MGPPLTAGGGSWIVQRGQVSALALASTWASRAEAHRAPQSLALAVLSVEDAAEVETFDACNRPRHADIPLTSR